LTGLCSASKILSSTALALRGRVVVLCMVLVGCMVLRVVGGRFGGLAAILIASKQGARVQIVGVVICVVRSVVVLGACDLHGARVQIVGVVICVVLSVVVLGACEVGCVVLVGRVVVVGLVVCLFVCLVVSLVVCLVVVVVLNT